ncbi:MAG: SPOR domain-containing protein [Luminiphilus sp.]|nr:SPOR domain-containing protein [Luminiphilus sp.]
MDDHDENDKRRVMTPPKEWGSDDDEADWLMASEERPDAPQPSTRPDIDDAGWLTSESDGAQVKANTDPTDAEDSSAGDWFAGGDITTAPETTAPLQTDNASPTHSSDVQPSVEIEEEAPDTSDPLEPFGASDSSEFSSMDLLTDHHIVGTTSSGKLPLWPTVAGIAAVVLLIIGGWGAISERSSLQNRIVELEERQATPQSLGSLDAGGEAVLEAENQALELQLTTLQGDYSAANDTIESLQVELDNAEKLAAQASRLAAEPKSRALPEQQIAARSATTPSMPQSDLTSASVDKANTPRVSGSSSQGLWFANVAAYSRRGTAENWAQKLQVDGYNAITQSVEIDGRTLYRVRAVGFETKIAAKSAAAELEATYNLGALWIGKTSAPPASNLTPTVTYEAAPSSTIAAKTNRATSETTTTASSANTADQAAGGWFIYVDTYAQGTDADSKAQQIEDAGYAAKVAVEYRSGELLYRVQIVGINSRAEGEQIIQALAAGGEMPNLQLRQY